MNVIGLVPQKDFRKVPHQRPPKKQKEVGEKALLWMGNCLKDRKQKVGLNGHFAESRKIRK